MKVTILRASVVSFFLVFFSLNTAAAKATATSGKHPELTDSHVLYLLKGPVDRTEIKADTLFRKIWSEKQTNDIEDKPVRLSALSKIKCTRKRNYNSYPRVAIIGPGSVISDNGQYGNTIIGNMEISGVILTVKDHLVIFPTLTTGFNSTKLWYEIPFGHARSANTHPTTLMIDGTLDIPEKSAFGAESSFENCGSVSEPEVDFVDTNIIVRGYFSIGTPVIKIHGEPRFHASSGRIKLEDMSLKAPIFTSEATLETAGNVVLEAYKVNRKGHSVLAGNLQINCKDNNYASESVCNKNDTVLVIKGDIELKAKTAFSLAFDPLTKEFSLGQIDIEKGKDLSGATIRIDDLGVVQKINNLDKKDQPIVVDALIKQKFPLIKSKTPIKHLPKLDLRELLDSKEENILKALQKKGKTLLLSYDAKTFTVFLLVGAGTVK